MANKVSAGEAFVRVSVDNSALGKGLLAAQKRLENFGAAVTGVGKKMAILGSGAAVAGGMIVAALMGPVNTFSEMGGAMQDMSQRTGMSVEALSELGFAAEQSGTDMATLEGGVRKMQKTIGDAASGSKEATGALYGLGLSVKQLAGLSPDQQFKLIADRISQIQDPALRTAAAMKIFGKSGTQLLPMLAGGAKGISEMQQQARDLGLTMSGEDAAAAEQFGDTLDVLWKVVNKVKFAIGAALAPTVSEVAQVVTRAGSRVIAWVNQNRQLIATIFKVIAVVTIVAAGIAAAGGAVAALGMLISFAASAIGGFLIVAKLIAAVFFAIISPAGLLIAALIAIAGYFLITSGVAEQALNWIRDRFESLKTEAIASWKAISAALARGDLAAAAAVVWAMLKMEWTKGVNYLQELWWTLTAAIGNAWTSAVYGLAGVFVTISTSIASAWESMLAGMRVGWTSWSGVIEKGINSLIGFFQKAWARLQGLFDETIDVDAEVRRIDEYTKSVNEGVDIATKNANDQRNRDAQAKKNQLQKDRDAQLAALDQMAGDEKAARERRFQDSLAQNQRELDAARAAWKDSLDAATGDAASDAYQPPKKTPQSSIDEMRLGLGTLPSGGSSKGTFNAMALGGLSADSLATKSAKATDRMDKNIQQLADQAKRNRLIFVR